MYLGEKIRSYHSNVRPLAGMVQALRHALAAQSEMLIAWAPVFLGAGIALYFGLSFEPPHILTTSFTIFILSVWALLWPLREGTWYGFWLALTAVSLFIGGFTLALWRTDHMGTIILSEEMSPVDVAGKIAGIDMLEEGQGRRLILEDLTIEGLAPGKTPQRVRVKVRGLDIPYRVGDKVELLAGLNPPSPPVSPGAFDFQRYAYFKGIGAFGFSYRDPVVLEHQELSAFGQKIEEVRQTLVKSLYRHIDQPRAAIAAALMTGERAAIAEEDWEALRGSGLAHMLAISGLHVGLVSGVVFFFIRLCLAAIPRIALYHPIKKYAALAAFVAALGYTLLVGATIPTIRALLMVGAVLLAVMVDRVALSIRLVALAALLILLLWPESVWSASFQMSFAAVTALIIFYDKLRPYLSQWYRNAGFVRRVALYICGVCLTTLVATCATAPFSLYHFQNLALYSLLANLVAVPIMALIVMPLAVLAYILIPFNLAAPVLALIDVGIGFILAVAHEVTALPDSVFLIPAMPLSVMVLSVIGGLIFLLWQGSGRMAALVPFLLAATIAWQYQPPRILVSGEGDLVALRDSNKTLRLSDLQKERFSAENWLQRNGQKPDDKSRWPSEGQAFDGLTCGEWGCRYTLEGERVAISRHKASHREDCSWADIMISADPVDRSCGAALVIDRFDVWRNGSYAIWSKDQYRSVRSIRGERPWTRYDSDDK